MTCKDKDSDNYKRSPFYKGLCSCGFFCKECVHMEISNSGWKEGLIEHFLCHTLLGAKILMWQLIHCGCMSGSEEWNTRNLCISVWKPRTLELPIIPENLTVEQAELWLKENSK